MIKKSWWVDLRFDHTRYRKRSPDNSRAGALAYEATLRHKLARGESIDGTSSEIDTNTTFERFAWMWFDLYVTTNNKCSEQYAKQKILTASIVPFFGKMLLSSIKTEHVERFKTQLKAQGVSNKTINNRLAVLGKCMRCAQDWYSIPIPTIKLLSCPPPKTNYLTPTECDLLLRAADGQILTMVLLALRTGMRQGELRGLQWPSIDWHNQSIAVRHSQCDRSKSLVSPKSNRERHIPLDVDVRNLLYQHKKDSGYVFLNPLKNIPYTSNRLVAALQILCKKAGIRKIGWHVLRHTFATQLTLGGTPVPIVKELLGHSSITTTMRYAHVTPVALRAAIESLNPRSQISELGQPVGNQETAYEKQSVF
jgi:integrase